MRLWTAPVAALVLSLTARARAEPSSSAFAEALFREGKHLLSAGKLDEACPKLEESQRLDPKPGTLINLAYCHERQGRAATAWGEYAEGGPLAARAKNKAMESFARDRMAIV